MITLYSLPSLVGAIFGFGVAAFVLYRNLTHVANVSFALGMSFLSASLLADFNGLLEPTAYNLSFASRFSALFEGLSIGAWLIFSLTYARSNYKVFLEQWKWAIAALGGTVLALWSITWMPGWENSFISLSGDAVSYPVMVIPLGSVGKLYFSILLVAIVAILLNLENTYRNAFWVKRWKIKYVLLGVGGMWAYYVYRFSVRLLYAAVDVNALTSKALVLLLCIVLLLFALIIHRQLDADIFVSRYVIYQSVSVTLIGVYLILTALLGMAVDYFGGDLRQTLIVFLLFASLMAFAVLALSEGVRRRFKVFISKHFYKYKYDYRVQWLELTERLSSKLSEKEVAEEFSALISDALSVRRVIVWTLDEVRSEYRIVYSTPHVDNITLNGTSGLVKALEARDHVVNLAEKESEPVTSDIYRTEKGWIDNLNISAVVPLRTGDRLVGFFAIGENLIDQGYDYEDYDLLKTIAKQVAHVMMTLRLTDTLMKGRELETFHKLSSFLLHDLKNSVSMLQLVSVNAAANMDNPEFQRDAMKAVQTTVEKMNNLISKISSFPREMKLEAKEVFLDRLAAQAVEQLRSSIDNGIKLSGRLEGPLRVSGDAENLGKVLTNLLLNALDALDAAGAVDGRGEVAISTYLRADKAVISVKDNGRGMSPEFMTHSLFQPFHSTKKRGIGIGLYQCKFIVEAHKGWIEVDSAPGEGTEFRIVLPAAHAG